MWKDSSKDAEQEIRTKNERQQSKAGREKKCYYNENNKEKKNIKKYV